MIFATSFDLSRVRSVVSLGSGDGASKTYGCEDSPILVGEVAQMFGVEFHFKNTQNEQVFFVEC